MQSLASAVDRSERALSHLPGFDLVLVVILKDAFIAQAQPPRDPLLVLQHLTEISQEKLCICAGLKRKERES